MCGDSMCGGGGGGGGGSLGAPYSGQEPARARGDGGVGIRKIVWGHVGRYIMHVQWHWCWWETQVDGASTTGGDGGEVAVAR